MKKDNILNPQLVSAVASLGHTEFLVVADAGLPIPPTVPVIDLSLVRGIPRFVDVVKAIQGELVVESYIYAAELPVANTNVFRKLQTLLAESSGQEVAHEEFKELVKLSKCVVRTGECSPYANVILVGGVNF